MKLEFSGESFKKSTNIKFQENPSSESRVVPADERKYRHDVCCESA